MADYKINFFFCIIPAVLAALMVVDSIKMGGVLTKWGREYKKDRQKEGFWIVMGAYGLVSVILFGFAIRWAYLWYKAS